MKLAEHPNVVNITGEIEAGPKDTVDTIIVVYTDLELDALNPRYQKDKVDSLIEAAHQHSKDVNSPANNYPRILEAINA